MEILVFKTNSGALESRAGIYNFNGMEGLPIHLAVAELHDNEYPLITNLIDN